MSGGAASRRQHQRFCEVEGWTQVRNARGQPTQHHITYELVLGDGSVLRTRISRPANTKSYGPGLWSHILNEQLCVTSDEFWECVLKGNPPRRAPPSEHPPAALPAAVAYQLVHTLHLSSDDIARLSLEEAVRLLTEHWGKPPPSG